MIVRTKGKGKTAIGMQKNETKYRINALLMSWVINVSV
jgi:hypothetical protein